MGSHSVTCHPTEVKAPRLNPSQIGRYSIYLPRRDGRLSWPRWLVTSRDGLPAYRQSPIAVLTGPLRTVTSLIGSDALPLHHAYRLLEHYRLNEIQRCRNKPLKSSLSFGFPEKVSILVCLQNSFIKHPTDLIVSLVIFVYFARFQLTGEFDWTYQIQILFATSLQHSNTFIFSPWPRASSTRSESLEQTSKHSSTTCLKLGISFVGQRYKMQTNKTTQKYKFQRALCRHACGRPSSCRGSCAPAAIRSW